MVPIDTKRIEDSFFSKLWTFRLEPGGAHATSCVDELCRRLPHIAPDSWPIRFELGGVYLNKRPALPSSPVQASDILEYYEPVFDPERAREFFPRFTAEMVLYADDDLAVVFKPAGLPSFHSRDQRLHNLYEYLTSHFGRKVHLPSRLDVGVSGVMLVSFTDRMNRYLQKAYERRWVQKLYVAEVDVRVDWEQRDVTLPLGRDPRHPVLRTVLTDGGQAAHTRFTRLAEIIGEDGSVRTFVGAEPITGRTHQIRVHSLAQGMPIVGDPYYSGAPAAELKLVSFKVGLFHPYAGRTIVTEIPDALRPRWLKDVVFGGSKSRERSDV